MTANTTLTDSTDGADFYLGRGADAQYLGTRRGAVRPHCDPFGLAADWANTFTVGAARPPFYSLTSDEYTEDDFRDAVSILATDTTWPWQWSDSARTDWAYAYDTGSIYVYHRGVEMMVIRCNHRRWVRADIAAPGGSRDKEEFVPRRAASFPGAAARVGLRVVRSGEAR